MSGREVAPNPFWFGKLTAALISRDRLSICVLAMFVHKSVDQLSMAGIGKTVKPPACFRLSRARDGDEVIKTQKRARKNKDGETAEKCPEKNLFMGKLVSLLKK